jgi:chromosome segregation ATPase
MTETDFRSRQEVFLDLVEQLKRKKYSFKEIEKSLGRHRGWITDIKRGRTTVQSADLNQIREFFKEQQIEIEGGNSESKTYEDQLQKLTLRLEAAEKSLKKKDDEIRFLKNVVDNLTQMQRNELGQKLEEIIRRIEKLSGE